MSKQKIKVGLLFGGRSSEHEVSVASALSVYEALDKNRYDVVLIGMDKHGRWSLPSPQQFLAAAHDPMRAQVPVAYGAGDVGLQPYPSNQKMIDVLFPVLHGKYGEDGTVQGLMELASIPYVGSGVLGSALGMDKEVSRILFSAAGIPTVPTLCVRRARYQQQSQQIEKEIADQFTFPLFVKPANAGSSVGVHKVKTAAALPAAMQDAFQHDAKVLIEKAVAARELEVSVLGNDDPQVSVVGEIVPTHEFYSYEAKYLDENGAHLHIPAKNVEPELVLRIQGLAKKAFLALQCRGLARVDFFLDKQTGELYLNEINTMPGFTKISMYPKLWEASGLSYPALLDKLIHLALE